MSRKDKLLHRLFLRPKDFRWDELQTLLSGLGYKEISGSGSRVKFFNPTLNSLIILHKPHPGSIMKEYALSSVIEKLEDKGIRP